MSERFTVDEARIEDLAPAFRLIFQHVRSEERELRVRNALELVEQGLLERCGVKVAREAGQLVGAVICAAVAGAGGIIWPAQAPDHAHGAEIEDQLMQSALRWLQQRGAKLVQSLLASHELNLGGILERNTFRHITDLWYMRHLLKSIPQQLPPTLSCHAYNHRNRDRFHATLMRTYEDTQDCPEVNGIRSIDEVIAGHRNQGTHDPQLWWLAESKGDPVGVVLLTEMPEWGGWDLIYLGVVKSARCRGVGRELTCRALSAAQSAGQRQLTLSVDARNEAALNLYRGAGFESYEKRAVYLSISSRLPDGTS
jgi:ribosomal protein S18 acetylase RimI-like enzyme